MEENRVLTYDIASGLVVLLDGNDGLYVDVTLALDSRSSLWATERLSTVMAIGNLEHSDVSANLFCLDIGGDCLIRSHSNVQLCPCIHLSSR